MAEVDLSHCDREPIHVIGHAQPHGVILALDPATLRVVQASESAESHFGLPLTAILGHSLLELLPDHDGELPGVLSTAALDANPVHLGVETVNGRGPFHLVAHIFDHVLIIEAEPADPDDATNYRTLPRRMLRRLSEAKNSQEFYEAIVYEARLLTGFDRTMLYRFLEDGTGVVVAESAHPSLEPYLGLRYPASDIPQQARRLFALNTVRLYPDVDYEPSPIHPPLNPQTGRPLDLTYCVLRGVSPVHTLYLQNMGVKASMALAITEGERLWGLIALHHYTPRSLTYPLRASCELLAGLASLQVLQKESLGEQAFQDRTRDVFDRLAERLRQSPLTPGDLMEGEETLLDLVPAQGGALVVGDELRVRGETPDADAIGELVRWLGDHQTEPVWATDRLAEAYPPARAFLKVGAGLLSAQISPASGAYALWFRPETTQTVRWAGDPNKPVEPSEFGDRLSPRRSFAVWKQEVAGLSQPWLPGEKAIVERLRLAFVEALVHRADEIMRLNVELAQRNEDLDTFAHVTAHDLREPLRGIRNYAQFVSEDYGDRIDEEGQAQLATIARLSGRLETLLDSLLRFVQLTREEIRLLRCDLGTAVAEAQSLVASAVRRSGGRIVVVGPLPTVTGDEHLLTEAFANLFTNAMKYNESDVPEVVVSAEFVEDRVVVSVRDNGIGIPPRYYQTIFQLFKRLHAKQAYGGGTGIGLTIVKRAVERLGGHVRVDSVPGEGSTFYLDLLP